MINEVKKALISVLVFFTMLSPIPLLVYLQFPNFAIIDFIGIVVIGFIFYLAVDDRN